MDLFNNFNFRRKDLGSASGQQYNRKKQKKVEPTLYQRYENLNICTGSDKNVIKWMDRIEKNFEEKRNPRKL
jgi:hypothetical protein